MFAQEVARTDHAFHAEPVANSDALVPDEDPSQMLLGHAEFVAQCGHSIAQTEGDRFEWSWELAIPFNKEPAIGAPNDPHAR